MVICEPVIENFNIMKVYMALQENQWKTKCLRHKTKENSRRQNPKRGIERLN